MMQYANEKNNNKKNTKKNEGIIYLELENRVKQPTMAKIMCVIYKKNNNNNDRKTTFWAIGRPGWEFKMKRDFQIMLTNGPLRISRVVVNSSPISRTCLSSSSSWMPHFRVS